MGDKDTYSVPPLQLPHWQTFILLHGRGSNGHSFGNGLVNSPLAPPTNESAKSESRATAATVAAAETLRTAFPHARFVFPTAPRTSAALYRGRATNQWFDNWKLDPPATERDYLQAPGLGDTTRRLHTLLESEIAAVPGGAASVVLGGLSQGCAAALVATLLWEGGRLGAVVGMCGWLPYTARISEEVEDALASDGEGEDDIFERGEDDCPRHRSKDPMTVAITWLREELQLGTTSGPESALTKSIPVFLGHGVQDARVNIILGRTAGQCLSDLGADVTCVEYEALGHWYSPNMLRDMADFVWKETGWTP